MSRSRKHYSITQNGQTVVSGDATHVSRYLEVDLAPGTDYQFHYQGSLAHGCNAGGQRTPGSVGCRCLDTNYVLLRLGSYELFKAGCTQTGYGDCPTPLESPVFTVLPDCTMQFGAGSSSGSGSGSGSTSGSSGGTSSGASTSTTTTGGGANGTNIRSNLSGNNLGSSYMPSSSSGGLTTGLRSTTSSGSGSGVGTTSASQCHIAGNHQRCGGETHYATVTQSGNRFSYADTTTQPANCNGVDGNHTADIACVDGNLCWDVWSFANGNTNTGSICFVRSAPECSAVGTGSPQCP